MIQLYWIFCVGFSIFVLSQEIYIYLIDNVHLIKWGCWLEYNFIKREFHISQSLSCIWLFATLWTAVCKASLSITNSWSLLKLMSIESVMPSNHLIFCRPLLLPPSVFPSIRVFSNESVLHIRWPKYWSFSFSISLPMNIQDWSLRLTGWISLQLKGLSRVFSNTTVQKHLTPYLTTGKTIALTRWTFVFVF